MSAVRTLNGQLIGRAHQATRALFDRVLAATGTTFDQWVALNLTAAGRPVDPAVTGETTAALLELRLVSTVDGRVVLTATGEARVAAIRGGIAASGDRIYAGIPAADLATAERVLDLVATRAENEHS